MNSSWARVFHRGRVGGKLAHLCTKFTYPTRELREGKEFFKSAACGQRNWFPLFCLSSSLLLLILLLPIPLLSPSSPSPPPTPLSRQCSVNKIQWMWPSDENQLCSIRSTFKNNFKKISPISPYEPGLWWNRTNRLVIGATVWSCWTVLRHKDPLLNKDNYSKKKKKKA